MQTMECSHCRAFFPENRVVRNGKGHICLECQDEMLAMFSEELVPVILTRAEAALVSSSMPRFQKLIERHLNATEGSIVLYVMPSERELLETFLLPR